MLTDRAHALLPNYCGIRQIALLVILGQVVAILLSLLAFEFWSTLALVSLFMQCVVLTYAVVLCSLRHWLLGFSEIKTLLVCAGIILGIVLVYSEISYQTYGRLMGHGLFLMRNLFLAAILAGVYLRYLYVQYQWQCKVASEARAQMESLQARIRPHFLFNSMNTITSLISTQPKLAEELMGHLADLFRQSLKNSDKRIALHQELALVKAYLNIEQLRLDWRLRVDWQLEELPQDALLPPLVIQPLVENAVYHGIEPLQQGGEITLRGRYQDEVMQIIIENPVTHEAGQRKGNHLAQQNITSRLLAWHGDRAGLKVEQDAERYRVVVTVPYEQR